MVRPAPLIPPPPQCTNAERLYADWWWYPPLTPPPTGIEKLGKQANGGTPPPSTPRYPHMYQAAAEADKSWYPPPPPHILRGYRSRLTRTKTNIRSPSTWSQAKIYLDQCKQGTTKPYQHAREHSRIYMNREMNDSTGASPSMALAHGRRSEQRIERKKKKKK